MRVTGWQKDWLTEWLLGWRATRLFVRHKIKFKRNNTRNSNNKQRKKLQHGHEFMTVCLSSSQSNNSTRTRQHIHSLQQHHFHEILFKWTLSDCLSEYFSWLSYLFFFYSFVFVLFFIRFCFFEFSIQIKNKTKTEKKIAMISFSKSHSIETLNPVLRKNVLKIKSGFINDMINPITRSHLDRWADGQRKRPSMAQLIRNHFFLWFISCFFLNFFFWDFP